MVIGGENRPLTCHSALLSGRQLGISDQHRLSASRVDDAAIVTDAAAALASQLAKEPPRISRRITPYRLRISG